ncbi:MAG: hypothetical protein WB763_04610 [Terriglobia bacterium]
MGRQSKWEYLRAVYVRYRRAERRGKQRILASRDAFELNCRIEEKREAIYELAQRRLSPSRASRPS